MLPCLIHEDDHLLVVNKPAGINTHAPSPYAGEGLYEFLRRRENRWHSLAIIHRLDKATSGVLVFAKTPLANRSLTQQFEGRAVRKRYVLLTDRRGPESPLRQRSFLHRAGERYVSGPTGDLAETLFQTISAPGETPARVLAEPLTGRTHQIRVHAADAHFPILGDVLYGGHPARRVCLHALELTLRHPESGLTQNFSAPDRFGEDPAEVLRQQLIDPDQTDAFRLLHGAADAWPGWYVDRLGNFLLSQSAAELQPKQRQRLRELAEQHRAQGALHKMLSRRVRQSRLQEASPQPVLGEPPTDRFPIRENGITFHLSFQEGYSVGLFLDQRENRLRVLQRCVAPGFPLFASTHRSDSSPEVLNTFAYTCGFSLCAAKAGRRTVSVDLSRKYLAWGRDNFALNGLPPENHEFLYGDVFDWLRRLRRKQRSFDLVFLDPPTFSQSRESGIFRVQDKLTHLAELAAAITVSGGVLFCSTNFAEWSPAQFLDALHSGIQTAGRRVVQLHYAPQPPDFPIAPKEPAYLKTAWVKLD